MVWGHFLDSVFGCELTYSCNSMCFFNFCESIDCVNSRAPPCHILKCSTTCSWGTSEWKSMKSKMVSQLFNVRFSQHALVLIDFTEVAGVPVWLEFVSCSFCWYGAGFGCSLHLWSLGGMECGCTGNLSNQNQFGFVECNGLRPGLSWCCSTPPVVYLTLHEWGANIMQYAICKISLIYVCAIVVLPKSSCKMRFMHDYLMHYEQVYYRRYIMYDLVNPSFLTPFQMVQHLSSLCHCLDSLPSQCGPLFVGHLK